MAKRLYSVILKKRNEINTSLMSTIGPVNGADVNVVEELLFNKLLEISPLPSNVTGLHAACLLNNFELVKLFVENGRDVNAKTAKRDSPLHLLLYGPEVDVDIVHYLINHGADLTLRDTIYDTPLYVAIRKKHVSAVRAILQYTHDINAINGTLKEAAYYGSLKIVNLAIANGADPKTAIFDSIRPGNSKIFKRLLEYAAYQSITNDSFDCLGSTVYESLSTGCMKVLLESPYSKQVILSTHTIGVYTRFNRVYKKICGVSNFMQNIERGHYEGKERQCEKMFDIMIENGYSVNSISEECIPPLTTACSQRISTSYIKKLIQHGADVNHPDPLSPDALIAAFSGCDADILLLLFKLSDFATPDSVLNAYVLHSNFYALGFHHKNIDLCFALGVTPSIARLFDKYYKYPDMSTGNICSLKQLCRISLRHMFHSKCQGLSINEILKKLPLPDSVCQYLKYEIV